MSNIVINSLNLSSLLKNIKLNKNYTNKLQSQILELNHDQSLTKLNNVFKSVTHIIYIIQNRTNLVMHVSDSKGNLIYSSNARIAGFTGKAVQRAQATVAKKLLQVLLGSNQLVFLKNKSIALHLTNIGFIKQWIVKKLKNFFFVESLRVFTLTPFNGCRKKKLRRKKIKKKS